MFDKALSVNPNLAMAYAYKGKESLKFILSRTYSRENWKI